MSTCGLSASPEETKGTLLDTADRQAEWIRRTFIDQTRRLVEQGGVEVNGEKVAAPTVSYTAADLTGEGLLIKKGKKVYHRAQM